MFAIYILVLYIYILVRSNVETREREELYHKHKLSYKLCIYIYGVCNIYIHNLYGAINDTLNSRANNVGNSGERGKEGGEKGKKGKLSRYVESYGSINYSSTQGGTRPGRTGE